MSAREAIALRPGAGALRVEGGAADVFLLADGGEQVPLATLGPGEVALAAARGATLRVVPRIGASLAPLERVPDEAATAFGAAVGQRVGGDDGARLSASAAAELPSALDEALPAYARRLREQRRERAARSERLDETLALAAHARMRADIERPGSAHPAGAADPLVDVLALLGERLGFAVAVPAGTDDDRRRADPLERLPALAHACGVRYRPVRLAGAWERPAATPYLAFLRDGDGRRPVALLPERGGYRLADGDGRPPRPLTDADRAALEPEAIELYAPLPRERAIGWTDVVRLALRDSGRSWRWIVLTGLGVALLGLLVPLLTTWVLGTVVPSGDRGLLAQAAVALGLAAIVIAGFSLVQYFAMSRLTLRTTQRLQAAFWDRVLSMPPSFFRAHTAGDLSVRVLAVDALQQLVNVQVIGTALAALFALVNVIVIFALSPILGLVVALVLGATLVVLAAGVRALQVLYTDSIGAQLTSTSWVVQALTGIAKVRLAGAERRLEARYGDLVREQIVPLARMTGVVGRVQGWLTFAFAGVPAAMFLVAGLGWAGAGSVSGADFLAINSAFVAAYASMAALVAVLVPLASARPIFSLLAPLMQGLPEAATHRADPGRLRGELELRDVSFQYSADGPVVLDRISLRVAPGEMVALVGPSGSGKSSTMRLVLGFDEPTGGRVLIDGRDLHDLDLDLVRSQMGVVVQNGQITRGPILKNILAGAAADEAAAWRAAEAAALADDIREMPMGMQTIVEPALLSGGQAQRLLLARALVRSPSVVLLDEATSALDNDSQERVTAALQQLGATRLVIAHRLSTIRSADRIVVLVGGRVVQQGTYDELLADADGPFATLARRQTA